VLLAQGIDVKLVVTHADDPKENIWFASVARLAREHGIDVAMPDDPAAPVRAALAALAPDFIFSFYYRHMLPARCSRRRAAAPSTCTARCFRSIAGACR
jgi:methionyl-tRNA formyltransferase